MRFFIVESVYVLGVCAIMPTEPDQVKYKLKFFFVVLLIISNGH